MENRRIKDIKSVYVSMPTLCCSCGKEISDEQMWEVEYINYLNHRIDPYYCCNKCMTHKKDVIKAFGATYIESDEKQDTFTQTDFLKIFIAILKIKEYKSFNCNILNEFIQCKINNNEYNRILETYNTKAFFEALKILIKEEYIYTSLKDDTLKVFINTRKQVTPLLENRLEYLEEMLSFTEGYKFIEKIENSKIKFSDKQSFKKRK